MIELKGGEYMSIEGRSPNSKDPRITATVMDKIGVVFRSVFFI